MIKKLWFILLLASCQLPSEDGMNLKVDAFLGEIPANKTAVIQLQNRSIKENSLEYKQFYRKLKPVLEAKGYEIVSQDQKPDVILKLYFGSQQTNYLRERSKVTGVGSQESAPFDEPTAVVTASYARTALYSKFLRMTAVDAKNPTKELWKIQIVKEDSAEDFRSAQDPLLYLFSLYAEKDSKRQIDGKLLSSEFYQRFVHKLSPAEADPYIYLPAERKHDYERRLQAKINAHATDFEKCGLKEKHLVDFEVSAFGSFSTFRPTKTYSFPAETLPEKVRICLADVLEPLLEPPLDIPTDEVMTIKLPFE